MQRFFISKSFLTVMGAILATGAVLNLANSGKLGTGAQKLANYVTSGFGAGPLSS